MIKRSVIIIIDGAGQLKHAPIGMVTGNAQFRDVISVITPLDLKDVVSVVFSKRNRIDDDVTQYLIPQGKLKGKDLLPQDHPLYQEVYNWNVFENIIDEKALTYLAKYRGDITNVSVNAGVQVLPHHAVNYKGVFGINNPLPTEELEDGDYYVCNTYNFNAEGHLWTLDDVAYYFNEKWHRANYRAKFGTEAFEIPVSSNIQSNVEVESDLDLAMLLAGRVADNEVAIGTHDLTLQAHFLALGALSDAKLDKHIPDTIPFDSDVVYGVDKEGNQVMFWVKDVASAIVRRTEAGNIIVYQEPYKADHATNKAYVDKFLRKSGGVMTGDLYFNGNLIKSLGDVVIKNGGKYAVNQDSVIGYSTPLSRLIAGLDLENDITADELIGQLREATTTEKGLMSAQDKQNLQTLLDLLEDDAEGTINTIKEIFAVFEGFSDDVVLIDLLNAKVNLTDEINGVTMADLISSGLWAEKVLFSDTNVGAELVRLETDKVDKRLDADLLLNTDKAKLDAIKDDGLGDKYLGDNLEYKTIKANQVKTAENGSYEGKGVEEALDYVKALTGLIIIDLGTFEDYDFDEPLDIGIFTGNTQETNEYTPLMAEMYYDDEADNLIIGTGDGKKERLVDA